MRHLWFHRPIVVRNPDVWRYILLFPYFGTLIRYFRQTSCLFEIVLFPYYINVVRVTIISFISLAGISLTSLSPLALYAKRRFLCEKRVNVWLSEK